MFTVLFTSIGRRVELVNLFKSSYQRQNIETRIIGVDAQPNLAPANYFVDSCFRVPWVDQANYREHLLQICSREEVSLLIPLYEPEFPLLEQWRSKFTDLGTTLLLTSKNTLEICSDKWQTQMFFKKHGIKTPSTWLIDNQPEQISWPLFGKPRFGMGSIGAQKIYSTLQFELLINGATSYIFQDFITGIEFTLDILSDFDGKVLSIVPRERLEVRIGEVSKSRTVDRPDLIEQGRYIAETLRLTGVSTIQCIDNGESVFWIEINPRLGGGVPLTIQAGVDYPYILYQLCQGRIVQPILGQYKPNLTMLRYDQAVYF